MKCRLCKNKFEQWSKYHPAVYCQECAKLKHKRREYFRTYAYKRYNTDPYFRVSRIKATFKYEDRLEEL